jgi:hypothetical protein
MFKYHLDTSLALKYEMNKMIANSATSFVLIGNGGIEYHLRLCHFRSFRSEELVFY